MRKFIEILFIATEKCVLDTTKCIFINFNIIYKNVNEDVHSTNNNCCVCLHFNILMTFWNMKIIYGKCIRFIHNIVNCAFMLFFFSIWGKKKQFYKWIKLHLEKHISHKCWPSNCRWISKINEMLFENNNNCDCDIPIHKFEIDVFRVKRFILTFIVLQIQWKCQN